MDASNVAQLLAAIRKEPAPKFDGKSNVDDWLVVFKHSIGNVDASLLAALPSGLAGEALEWYCSQERRTDKPGTFAAYEELLKKAFKRSLASIRDELESRTQKSGEQSVVYFREVMRLCNQLDPDMDAETQVRWLTRGLRPDLQRDMILLKPKTPQEFQDFLSIAARTTALAADSSSSRDKLLDTLLTLLTKKESEKTAQTPSSSQDVFAVTRNLGNQAFQGYPSQSVGPGFPSQSVGQAFVNQPLGQPFVGQPVGQGFQGYPGGQYFRTGQAFPRNQNFQGNPGFQGNRFGGRGPNPDYGKQCRYCGRMNHIERNCRTKQYDIQRQGGRQGRGNNNQNDRRDRSSSGNRSGNDQGN
jgi:hypothetical protein